MLQENHINAIVSLTDDLWVWWNTTTREAGVPDHRHKWVQCVDSSTQDLLAHMSDISDFFDGIGLPALSSLLSLPVACEHETNDKRRGAAPEAILIYCDLGISRSSTIIIAYLMRKLNMQQADIFQFVQSKQKIKPSTNFTRQLQVWERLDTRCGRMKIGLSRNQHTRHFWSIGIFFFGKEVFNNVLLCIAQLPVS